jgi:hypothetical protein
VRASLAFGRALRLRGPSVATWQLRLLVEAGILQPYPVSARPLPSDVRPAVRTVYDGFLLLFWLLAQGYLRQVGQHRQMALFLPG